MFQKSPVLNRLSFSSILVFWAPLALTWLIMSLESPYLTALIARLNNPKENLAAFGVAFSLAIFVEAPVMMLLAASTALVEDRVSYLRLRNYSFGLFILITLFMVLLVVTPAFDLIAISLMDLPTDVAMLAKSAFLLFLPFPAAVGYRRLYQGILIKYNRPRRVATATLIRLLFTLLLGFIFFQFFALPGVLLAALTLSISVTVEAAVVRRMARRIIFDLKETASEPISYKSIMKFYVPLALTPSIILFAQPIITYFMSQSQYPLESLAVYPVVSALAFIFRSFSLAYHEVVITKVGDNFEHRNELFMFALALGTILVLTLGIISFTPLVNVWFITVSGLAPELAKFAIIPIKILVLLPGVSTIISLQRALLVKSRATTPITIASVIELIGIALSMWIFVKLWNWNGAIAASASLLISRGLSSSYLFYPTYCTIKSKKDTLKTIPA